MDADHRKKRYNSASVAGYNSRQQHSVKRMKVGSPQCGSSTSNVILEWDDKRKSVVAKKEQIAVAQRNLSPFSDEVPSCHNILADVVNVPLETFDLKSLTDVLSFEVWQTCLSQDDRSFLTQFLPKGFEAHQVVQELLEGDNFHFGNPFLKWDSLLCSGDLHPDAILKKECLLKANKKAYHVELQNYHYDMIRDLQFLKARWSQTDPENDAGQNFWRSRKDAENSLQPHVNKSTTHDFGNNLTSESCSSDADDKACSSDEINLRTLHEDSQERICRKGFKDGAHDNASDGLKLLARQRKKESVHKHNAQFVEGANYMSYIKVSKEQLQRVKSSMKHSSNSIQSRSLHHVLGDIGTYYVQPYKVFEEEERQKLHVHWSKLANLDIAAAFKNWSRRQIEKRQLIHALRQEMDEKERQPKNKSDDQVDDGESDSEPSASTEGEGSEISNSLIHEQMDNVATNHESSIALEDGEHGSSNCIFEHQIDNAEAIGETVMDDQTKCVTTFSQNHHLQHYTVHGGNHVFHTMDLGSDENDLMPEAGDLIHNASKFTENLSEVDVSRRQENPLSVACDVWPAASVSNAYYSSPHVCHDYSSVSESSHEHSQVIDKHPSQLINLKADMVKVDPGNDMLNRQLDDVFFSSYTNQVRNEQFGSFFSGLGSVQQKATMLDFHPLANAMIENSQHVGRFREHLHPSMAMNIRPTKLNDAFLHQSMQNNVCLDGLRPALPKQDNFSTPLDSSTLNMQSWGASAIQLPGPSQSHRNGEEVLSHNWVSVEGQCHGGWSDVSVSQNQSSGIGGIADESLFNILSQRNNLIPGSGSGSLSSLTPQQRYNQSLHYSDGVVPAPSFFNGHESTNGRRTNNINLLPQIGNQQGYLNDNISTNGRRNYNTNLLPQIGNQHSYLNGLESTNGRRTNNTGWPSLPHHNTALHDYWNH